MSFTVLENNSTLSNRIIHQISPFNGGVIIKGLNGKPLHLLHCLPSQIEAVMLALMPSMKAPRKPNCPNWDVLLSVPTPVVPPTPVPVKGSNPVK